MAPERSLFAEADAAREAGDVNALIDLLQRGDQMTRVTAARHLGEMRSIRAVEPLVQALAASDWLVRSAALNALGAIGDKTAADAVAAIADDVDPRAPKAVRDQRVSVAVVLTKLGDTRSLDLLAAIAADRNAAPRARRWAIGQLVELRAESFLPALRAAAESMSGIDRWRAKRAIEKLAHVTR
jgi:HEAT repeat protein